MSFVIDLVGHVFDSDEQVCILLLTYLQLDLKLLNLKL